MPPQKASKSAPKADASEKAKSKDRDWLTTAELAAKIGWREHALRDAMRGKELPGVRRTSFGYHVIKLVDRASGAPLSFEDAKDQVREELLNEKRRKRYEEFVASLRAKAKLRVADIPLAASEIPVTGPAAATP